TCMKVEECVSPPPFLVTERRVCACVCLGARVGGCGCVRVSVCARVCACVRRCRVLGGIVVLLALSLRCQVFVFWELLHRYSLEDQMLGFYVCLFLIRSLSLYVRVCVFVCVCVCVCVSSVFVRV